MSSIDEKTLKSLGLEPTARVQSIESAHWGDSGTGFGFSSAEPASFYATAENALSERVPLTAFEDATGGQVRRHVETGGVSYLSVPGARLRPVGVTVKTAGEALVVDSRTAPSAVRIDLDWFTYVLLFDGSAVEVLSVEQVNEIFRPSEVPAAATAEMLFGDLPVEPWLVTEVRVRASLPSTWSRAMAAGLAARLWWPPKHSQVSAEALRRGGSPASRALAWCASLREPDRDFLEHTAVRTASQLLVGLELAVSEAEAEPAEPPGSLHDLALRRDDAACVQAVLPVSARSAVGSALTRVDRAAEANWSSLSLFAWPKDERLRAVRRSEPEAWWGRLSRS